MSVAYTSAIADFIQKLETGNPLPPLVPEQESCADLTETLQAASTDALFEGQHVKDSTFADAIKSGLLLWNDALDASHTISQELANATGSYWHGIMHRREPDYSNAKYWFGRVGTHAIFPEVRNRAIALYNETAAPSAALASIGQTIADNAAWDASQFIDWCQAAESATDADVVEFLQRVQVEEMRLLLAYSYRNAV